MYKIIMALILMVHQGFCTYLENDLKLKNLDHLRYLEDLFASGSEQFSEGQLAIFINDIVQRRDVHPSKIVVIDLRKEAHFFADGIPFTITDKHEDPSKEYTYLYETEIQKKLIAQGFIKLDPRQLTVKHHKKWKKTTSKEKQVMHKKHSQTPHKPITLIDPIIKTEAEICKNYGIQYWRLPLTDHFPPEKKDIEEFIKFVSSLPKDTWIHIHCRGGEGRTTTFLAILEMLHFKNHSLYDILTRQYHVGGKDLLKMPEEVDRQQAARDRLDVIRRTYDDLH